MKALKSSLLSTSICAALMLGSAVVHAQSTTEDGDNGSEAAGQVAPPSTEKTNDSGQPQELQTIEVTARGVAESLQNAPLPITAVTQETIEKKGLTDINDIAAMSPSFSFDAPFGRNLSRPVIRGMSNILGEANASFFINGVYVEGDVSAYGLQNIQRVEVIRGPQSAQFGRRTFSGAVNFITKVPGAEPGGKVTLGMGNYGQHKEGVFYSNHTDDGTFGFDISAYRSHNDGTFYNQASDRKDLGGRDSRSFMLAAHWAPTLNLDITGRIMYQKNRDQMWPIARLGSANSLNCYLPEYSGILIGGTTPLLDSRRQGAHCGEFSAPSEYGMNTREFRAAGYFPGTKYNYLRNSLQVKYAFENGWELTSTSAYNTSKTYQGVDQDYSDVRGFGGAFESITQTRSYDLSENIRLASDQTLPFSGVIGLYYYKQVAQKGFHGSLAGFYLPPTMSVQMIPDDPDASTVAKAVYGMLKWDINDRWTAALEARYARDEIHQGGTDVQVLGDTTYTRPYSLSRTFTNLTPRATLTYHVNDHVNLYGLASKGTKPGGFNLDAYRADFTDEAFNELIERGLNYYKPSTVWNYELGLKSDLLDGRLRLNADVYQINWDGQQLTQGTPAQLQDGSLFSTSYIANVGESRIRGFELESAWLFAEGWQASLTYSYTDAKVRKYFDQDYADRFCGVPAPTLSMPCANAAGNRLPLVPKQLASLGLLYTGQFGNGWGYDFSFDTHYHGKEYAGVSNLAVIPSSVRSNVRLNLRPGDRFEVSFYVNNVFNDHTPSGVMSYIDPTAPVMMPAVPPIQGYGFGYLQDYAVSPSLPRMYGVDIGIRF